MQKLYDYTKHVISSQIKLVRNISDIPFTENLSRDKKNKLETELKEIIKKFHPNLNSLKQINESRSNFLLDNNIINKNYFESSSDVYIHKNFSIYLNADNHITIESKSDNLNLEQIYQNILKLETEIEQEIPFAVSPRYGFISPNIHQCGLGLQLSALIHLPGHGLTGQIDELKNDLIEKGYILEEYKKDDTNLYIYTISSRINYGISENELIKEFNLGINSIIKLDVDFLKDIYNKKPEIDDLIYRSYGLLLYAKRIGLSEALFHFSNIRMGIALGFNLEIDMNILNIMQNSILRKNFKILAEKSGQNEDQLRGSYIQKHLYKKIKGADQQC